MIVFCQKSRIEDWIGERQNKKIVIVLVTILELFSLLCNLNSALMETERDGGGSAGHQKMFVDLRYLGTASPVIPGIVSQTEPHTAHQSLHCSQSEKCFQTSQPSIMSL